MAGSKKKKKKEKTPTKAELLKRLEEQEKGNQAVGRRASRT